MRKIPSKEIIREIDALFERARKDARLMPKNARKIIALARKTAKRNNFSLKKYRRLFCHKCNSYFIPGKNCNVRFLKGKKVIKCLECGSFMRIKLLK